MYPFITSGSLAGTGISPSIRPIRTSDLSTLSLDHFRQQPWIWKCPATRRPPSLTGRAITPSLAAAIPIGAVIMPPAPSPTGRQIGRRSRCGSDRRRSLRRGLRRNLGRRADCFVARQRLRRQQLDCDHHSDGDHRRQQPELDDQRRRQRSSLGYPAGTGIVMQPGGALNLSPGTLNWRPARIGRTTPTVRLTVAGNVIGAATVGNTTTLTLGGLGSGVALISGVIADGNGGGNLAVAVSSSGGPVVLSGSSTYSGGTTDHWQGP